MHGAPFQGTSELLRIRFLANVDPHADIINFNATHSGFSEVEEHPRPGGDQEPLHRRPRQGILRAVVNRLTLTDQRVAVDLDTIQLWSRHCYASNVKAGVTSGLSAATLAVDTGENEV
ncbi:hypothetical protein CYMTET_9366 [Cymbomonas tetramitiformis]|uniref:Uncharacterized protein n=1 Tax=Cymbomonas tetramitiformis TaxID=36881 RepID=A0AAE0F4M8_9CHLO|nr:hypothetical protein CYMTET_39440 [Cymbomonas tetramitiformis]KAK3282921.1 hypothetical protein CYMTET_9366 [Cymbomonas tetramitiformis]